MAGRKARPQVRRRGIVKAHPASLRGLASHSQTGGAIAPGFTPEPAFDMTYQGGRTIPALAYTSVYLDGAKWAASDVANIDAALAGALSDKGLNNVLLQYYPGRKSISTTFLGSRKLAGGVKKTFTRDDVNPVLAGLLDSGALAGLDFDQTVVCLFLPPGIVLTDKAKGGVGKARHRGVHALKGDDDHDSSRTGLGGYHGSCHLGATRIYFAVGVYSQFIGQKPNGIPFWPDPWKNIVATFYHELVEARTDPDVEEFNRTGHPGTIGWYANVRGGGEIGDIPMNQANHLGDVMVEVKLGNGQVAPIQLMWSNRVHGPQGPFR